MGKGKNKTKGKPHFQGNNAVFVVEPVGGEFERSFEFVDGALNLLDVGPRFEFEG